MEYNVKREMNQKVVTGGGLSSCPFDQGLPNSQPPSPVQPSVIGTEMWLFLKRGLVEWHGSKELGLS